MRELIKIHAQLEHNFLGLFWFLKFNDVRSIWHLETDYW